MRLADERDLNAAIERFRVALKAAYGYIGTFDYNYDNESFDMCVMIEPEKETFEEDLKRAFP